jgi:hypothetical protein
MASLLETLTDLLGTSYSNVSDESDYGLYDPTGSLDTLSAYISELQNQETGTSTYDSSAWLSNFGTAWSSLSDMVSSYTKSLEDSLLSNASEEAKLAGEAASEQFGSLGESGALASAVGTAQAQPFADVASQIAESSANMMSSLGSSALSASEAASEYADTSNLNWANLSSENRQAILSALLGQSELSSTITTPTYVEDSFWDKLLGALG